MKLPECPGIYVVIGSLPNQLRLELGAFRDHLMDPGIYCYCGSAKGPGGLNARVRRHLNKMTKKFWHFDYLKENLEIKEVWWRIGKDRKECEIAQILASFHNARIPIRGFGSSDCKNGCFSHLIYFEDMQIIDEIYLNSKSNGVVFERKKLLTEEIG